MYICNTFINNSTLEFSKYKQIGLYDEDITATYLLTKNKPIKMLDMFKPNSITDISHLLDSYPDRNPQFYNLDKYIHDNARNPNGAIKKNAKTDLLVHWRDGDGNDTNFKAIYLPEDKTLTQSTFIANIDNQNNNSGNVVILTPLNYYFYHYNSASCEIGTKPQIYQFTYQNLYSGSIAILGNITREIINKLENNTFDNIILLAKNVRVSQDKASAFRYIYVLCSKDNINKYKCKVNNADKSIDGTIYDFIHRCDIGWQSSTFTVDILNRDTNASVSKITITVG